jgi:hypothetical protein
VQNTRSRLETRLARLVAATPPLTASNRAGRSKVDLVYLSEEDQERLEARLR